MTGRDDSPVAVEELLEHQGWLRAVARALIGDEQDVDDIVQATYLTAIESPPRSREKLRGWMWAVMANHTRMGWRRGEIERRALANVRVANVDEDSARAAERVEVEALVRLLVLELPPKYRNVILQHYFNGFPLVEIARRNGEPPASTRSRACRAIALLRRNLSVATGEPPERLPMLLVPLLGDGVRPLLEEPGARHRLIRRSITACAVGVLVVATGALVRAVVSGGDTVERPGTRAASTQYGTARERTRVGRTSRAARGDEGGLRSKSQSVLSDDPGLDAARVVRVIGALPRYLGLRRGGAQASDGADWTLTIRAVGAGETPAQSAVATVGVDAAQSKFAIDALFDRAPASSGEFQIEAEHPMFLPVRWTEPIRRDAPGKLRLSLSPVAQPAGVVRGVFTDRDGRPVEGAHVALLEIPPGANRPRRTESVITDETGQFRLRATPSTPIAVIGWTEDSDVAMVRRTSPASGAEIGVSLSRLDGVHVAGRIDAPRGFPMQAITVVYRTAPGAVTAAAGGQKFWLTDERAAVARHTATVSADGRFRFPLATSRGGHLEIDSDDVAADAFTKRRVEYPRDGDVILLSTSATPLTIKISDAAGPRAAVSGRLLWPSGALVFTSDAEGYATVWVRPGATYELTIATRGFANHSQTIVVSPHDAPDPVEVELVPSAARVTWWVEVPPGTAPTASLLGVGLFAGGDSTRFARYTLEGVRVGDRFRVSGVPRGQFRASLRLGSKWTAGLSEFVDVHVSIDSREGEPRTTRVEFRVGGRLLIGARDADGALVKARCTILRVDGSDVGVGFVGGQSKSPLHVATYLGDAGLVQLDRALAPGTYTVRVEYHDHVTEDRTVTIGADSLEELVFQLRRP